MVNVNMDDTTSTKTSTTRRLTKKPPPGSAAALNLLIDVRSNDAHSLRSQRSSGSLQRSPSAPTWSRQTPAAGHSRKITSPDVTYTTSSSSSLDRQISAPSPNLAGSEFMPSGQGGGNRISNPLNEKSSDDSLIGAPFDGSGILNHIDSTKATGYQNSLRRPPPPPLSHTNTDPRVMSPPLRQSASFSAGDKMNEKTPPRISENQLITPKRYSDESNKEPKPGVIRKQSGLKSIFGSMGLMSPRGPKISAPENPVHVTHVGYDNQTGQFTVSSVC